MQESISQFCVLAYDELNVTSQYREKAREIQEKLGKSKVELQDFASKQGQSCIPVTFEIDGEQQKLYLRFMEKMTPKSINLDAFKNVVAILPPTLELQEIFRALKDPTASLGDVYAAWLYNNLYTKNTTKKQTFQISASGERKKKGEGRGHQQIHVPDNILQQTASFAREQNRLKWLKKMKTEKIRQINEQKEKVEPLLQAHFQSRPDDKQFHKISMEIDGETKPWFIRRVVKETKPSSISLNKVKPLIFRAVSDIIAEKTPFDPKTAETYFQTNRDVTNNVFFRFRLNFEDYKQANMKVSSLIKLSDKEKSRKRKSQTDGDEEEGGEEEDGGEGNNDDEEDNDDDAIDKDE